MYLRNALAAALVTASALAGCGSGDDEPAAPEAGESADDGGAVDAGADDGGGSGGDSGGDDGGGDDPGAGGSDRPASVRDDYPIPFPPGWVFDILGDIGMEETSGAQLLYPNDAYDEVVAFYDDWFESQPEEYGRTVQSDGFVIYQILGDTYYQVSIAPDYEERGETYVTLQVSGGEVN